MRIARDTDTETRADEMDDARREVRRPEDTPRARRKKRRKQSGILTFFVFLGCFAMLVLAVFLGTALFMWMDGAQSRNNGSLAASAGQTGEDAPQASAGQTGEDTLQEQGQPQEVTYTQAQLDELTAQARQEGAQQEAQRILEGLKQDLAGGTSAVEALRPLYPEDILVVSGGKFNFVPIDRGLKASTLVQENVQVLENGQYVYREGEQIVSHRGIDVSKHQGAIDWAQVAADGVEFAFIRVGNRGYGTGAVVLDERFAENITGAVSNGIKAGVYFFSQAITEAEALEEAQFVLTAIAPYRVECPVIFDVEKVGVSDARMNALSQQERIQIARVFCQTIAQAGYTPMIYCNMETAALLLDWASLEDYEKWYAYYGETLYFPYAYSVWQYSDKGKVPGINTDVDLNISFTLWE